MWVSGVIAGGDIILIILKTHMRGNTFNIKTIQRNVKFRFTKKESYANVPVHTAGRPGICAEGFVTESLSPAFGTASVRTL